MVFVSARRTFSRCVDLMVMFLMCWLNVIPRSIVTPMIFVVGVVGMRVLLSVMWGSTVYSLLYGVMRVSVDLFAETFSLFVLSQFSSVCMYV